MEDAQALKWPYWLILGVAVGKKVKAHWAIRFLHR
jgi:hypothetical protein